MEIVYAHKQVVKKLGITSRQLIYFNQKGVVHAKGANGRGTSREYTEANIAEVKLGIALRDMGMTVERTAEICDAYRALCEEYPEQDYTYMVLTDNGDCWFENNLPDGMDEDKSMLVIGLDHCRPGFDNGKI